MANTSLNKVNKITKLERIILDEICAGLFPGVIAKRHKIKPIEIVKVVMAYKKEFGFTSDKELETYWPTEIFQIGLRELGYV
jgi:hypothetical protein